MQALQNVWCTGKSNSIQSSCGFNVIANCNPYKEYYDIGNQSIFGQDYNLDKQNVILVLNI